MSQRELLEKRLHLPYISVGDGWLDLVEGGVEALAIWDTQLFDVKEKLGGVRVTIIGPHHPEVDRIVEALEYRSYEVCEVCGERGLIRMSRAWIRTLCDDCHAEARV
jgi:hypothetical protein